MAITIKKIVLNNFKKFQDFSADFNDEKNIIVGENETGKSTILTAIDLTLSASYSKIERVGFENLFNITAIDEFQKLTKEERSFDNLPILSVDIYLKGICRHDFDGKINRDGIIDYGIRLEISPNSEEMDLINNILKTSDIFPFEYYKVSFRTFAAKPYDKYSKVLSNIFIDNSEISGEHAKREYVREMYYAYTSQKDRVELQRKFREKNENFSKDNFTSDTNFISFKVTSTNKFSLENQIHLFNENKNRSF